MEYIYCENKNYEDYASGHVLYGGKGIPNFPVRLLNEIFGRCQSYIGKKENLTVYDPCCGGGYSLTVLGFFHPDAIGKLYGSDVEEEMVLCAKKNTSLLSYEGLEKRMAEIESLYKQYQKESHKKALESGKKLKEALKREIAADIFVADCTKELPQIQPDIIITDVPYGNLVTWKEEESLSVDKMLEQLAGIACEDTILAVCMDKRQKINSSKWKRLEKQNIGKRKFEILKYAGDC